MRVHLQLERQLPRAKATAQILRTHKALWSRYRLGLRVRVGVCPFADGERLGQVPEKAKRTLAGERI
jgi:hypothetical protein